MMHYQKKYMQAGFALSDKNDDHQSKKSYSVAIDKGPAKVTQKIRYFLRAFDDPSQVKGAFDRSFTTTIDVSNKSVLVTLADIVPVSDDLPLKDGLNALMGQLSFH